MKRDKTKKRVFDRWRFWVFLALPSFFLIIAIFGAIIANRGDTPDNPFSNEQKQTNQQTVSGFDKIDEVTVEARKEYAEQLDSILSEEYNAYVYTKGPDADVIVVKSSQLNKENLSERVFKKARPTMEEVGFRKAVIGDGLDKFTYNVK